MKSDQLRSSNCTNQTPHLQTVSKKMPITVANDSGSHVDFLLEKVPDLAKYFSISCKIGSGTFSSVYLAKLKADEAEEREVGQGMTIQKMEKQLFALKHIIPTSHPTRIESELRCLRDMGGHDNIIGLTACIRHKDHVVIIMPYFPHDKFQDYVRNLSLAELQLYMRALLTALKRIHVFDFIHRDIKPSNFLYNRQLKRFILVDFGLAQKAPVPLRSETLTNCQQISAADRSVNKRKEEKCDSAARIKSSADDEMVASISTTLRKRKFDAVEEDECESSLKKRRVCSRIKLDFDTAPTDNAKSPVNGSDKTLLTNTQNQKSNDILNPSRSSKSTKNVATGILKTSAQENFAELQNGIVEKVDNLTLSAEKSSGVKKRVSLENRKNCGSKIQTTQSPLVANCTGSKNKSPRRALLTRRAMDLERRASLNLAVGGVKEEQQKGVARVSPEGVANKTQGRSKFGGRGTTEDCDSAKSTASSQGNENSQPVKLCDCFNRPTVCKICLSRRSQIAPRAGTSGFRAPEVLMRHPDQTTSVDIWAAGVIFLSLLSGRYPFFKSADDLTALAQIMAILGTDAVTVAANAIGKNLVTNASIPPVDLRQMCQKLRGIGEAANEEGRKADHWYTAPNSAYSLLQRLLDPNPKTRLNAEDALSHTFFSEDFK